MIENKPGGCTSKGCVTASVNDVNILLCMVGIISCFDAIKSLISMGIDWFGVVFLIAGISLILVSAGVIKLPYKTRCRMVLVLFETASMICTISVIAVVTVVSSLNNQQFILLHAVVIAAGATFAIVLYKLYKYYVKLGGQQI